MWLIAFLISSGLFFFFAYRILGRKLSAYFALDADARTPAHQHRDGVDFEAAKTSYLLPQHFSAIAAAGPIVGPILAGTLFGWFPTWIWILVGAVFIGGIHDFATLIASVRHDGRSIAEVVRQYMNGRSFALFLLFIWVSLIYVLIAFTDVTAGTFVQAAASADAAAPGPAVATSSIVYLLLAVLMGLALRFTGMSALQAKLVFLPLVFAAIWLGPQAPLDLSGVAGGNPQRLWNYILIAYCFLASIAPLWLLLQPRGYLGGYFLYLVLLAGVAGIIIGGLTGAFDVVAPPIMAGSVLFGPAAGPGVAAPMLPILFITVACGACSGFHSIVASGTTSKQLDRETDATPVAYGGMLLEGFFACLSLATVMILASPAGKPDAIYAGGISRFVEQATFGLVGTQVAFQFALLCFATFVFDTLDACTRLARYVLMELTGWKGRAGAAAATALTLVFPLIVLSIPPLVVDGQTIPAWRIFWNLFGMSNQLLAALALLGVAVWLHKTGRNPWLGLAPALFMAGISLWALGLTLHKILTLPIVAGVLWIEAAVATVLAAMALWLLVEAFLILRNKSPKPVAV
ncbi:MAG: carbon starvation protein A [Chthoniobacterales bacterium]